MKKLISILLLVVPTLLRAETKTVDHVDLNRYLGTWYEIASIPKSFSKGCYCSKAQYGLNDNGTVSVLNTCNKKGVTGKLASAKGIARVADKNTNAKLRVSFFWPFFGDYWIIGLDKEYRYAVVSNRSGNALWILSRTPELEESLFQEALSTAHLNGVDIQKLNMTVQQGCP